MDDPSPRTQLGSELRSHFSLIAKCAGRGLVVWVAYLLLGVLVGWSCFRFAAADIWSGGMGPMGAHAGGGFGAVVFLFVLLLMPPFWASIAYVVGAPLAFAFVGHAMAFKAALQHALEKKSDLIAESICALSWPVAKRLAGLPGTTTLSQGTRALLDHFEGLRDTTRLTRWFLGRAIRALKISEIFTTTDLLARIKTEPDAAMQTLRSAIEARLREATSGRIFTRAWLLSAIVVVVTLARRFWIGWYQ